MSLNNIIEKAKGNSVATGCAKLLTKLDNSGSQVFAKLSILTSSHED